MTDPRLKGAGKDRLLYAQLFDVADKDAGVVRVDTRDPDPAQVDRVARVLAGVLGYGETHEWEQWRPDARTVLAALTEATP